MSNTIVVSILENTKSLIDTQEKWLQGIGNRNWDGLQCYCFSVAFGVASHHFQASLYRKNALNLLQDEIDKKTHFRCSSLISFNDHPDTKHGDVMKILDAAIEKAKQQTPVI